MVDSKDIKIRKATLNDIDKIEVLLQELIGDPLNDRRRFYNDAFSSEDYVGLVAEKEGNIIGFVDLWGFPDPGHGAVLGVIMNFIVSKEHRKMGIGAAFWRKR
ncbi:MAG: GNAT family N-acetyltransferase [Methanomassiliicoccales archaeon]|nr:MAG: GNAT family N-acetyltransferase [Methanomassiliicoccales archaeon]